MLRQASNGPNEARRGPGNPGKRATLREIEERVSLVARMLCGRLHKHQIVAYLKAKFELGSRSSENYISRARAYLIERSKKSRDNFVAEAIGFYEDIIRDPESSTRIRMDAQAALRQLLGLDMPFKIAPTALDGQSPSLPAEVIATASMDELAVLRSLHLRAQRHRAIPDGRVHPAVERLD